MDLDLIVPISKTRPVIMVDDSPTDIFIARRCFLKTGYANPFVSFSNGEAFLHYMQGVVSDTQDFPALVLLDINMPKLNGFDVLRSVRKEKAFADIPFIMVFTNSNHSNDRKLSRELGANGFHTKPYELPQYLEFFRSLFEARS